MMTLDWPVNPSTPISSKFGFRLKPKVGMHSGVDFACPMGTAIYPVYKGEVIFVGPRGNYGLIVIIHHPSLGNVWSLYGHLSHFKYNLQSVKHGDMLGYTGSSGWSTGPHLHLELRVGFNGILAARDPMKYLKCLT